MFDTWLVVIESVNKVGKIDRYIVEEETFIGATRILYTYHAKKGYTPIKYSIEKIGKLF